MRFSLGNINIRKNRTTNLPYKSDFVEIMADPEKRKKSVKLGWTGIIFALICVALVWPCCWLGVTIFNFGLTYLGIFTILLLVGNIVLIMLGICCFFIPLYLLLYGVICPIMQLIINPRKAIGWIGLFVWLLSVASTILLAINSISKLAA